MYETEIKVEITEDQRQKLLKEFLELGFVDKGITPQQDYYVSAIESRYGHLGSFDIERYRREGDRFDYTKKFGRLKMVIRFEKKK